VSVLAARLARWRVRSRAQRAELAAALARIRELATRDELTGLVNRRHLQELLEQEHQRCIRSGHTFCIAVLQLADPGSGPEADALIAGVAQEALRGVRVADVLGRWDRTRFVLLMSDSRALLARGALDRLRERVADGRYGRDRQLRVALTASLAEHHAGETVAQTLARAEAALAETSPQGDQRVALS
jgi:diguanylate cyclase (GGDEF)-like protein